MQSPLTPPTPLDVEEQKRQLLIASAKQRQSFDPNASQQDSRGNEFLTRRLAQRGVEYSALND